VLTTAKALINAVKFEEQHIFNEVDNHVSEIVSSLDHERIEDYLKFREQIAHDRLDKYFEEKKEKGEPEGQKVYTRPRSETYHLIKDCGGKAADYGKAYEAKNPCRLCKETTQDTINSSILPKGIGFIKGSDEYHDDDCLIWVSHKDRILKQICRTCEDERVYAEDIKRQLTKKIDQRYNDGLTGSSRSTGSRGTQEHQRANDDDLSRLLELMK
jgi:hypothetical protein